MEHLVRDIALIITGGLVTVMIYLFNELRKSNEQRRWEQWYRDRNRKWQTKIYLKL